MTTTANARPQSVMDRALLLLEPFRDSTSLTLTDLAQCAGLPRSSAHRMLAQLVEVGWLRRHGTTYHLGPKMMELGSLARSHDRIHRATVATMYRLHRQTQLAVHLSVLEGADLLYLEKVGGRWAADLATHVGQRRPALETIEGVTLLTHVNGLRSSVHETVTPGTAMHQLALAFDAGAGEVAALSLIGPTPAPEAAIALREAADRATANLARRTARR